VRCLSKDNEEKTCLLQNVKSVPELMVNLLSIPVALNNGFQIGNEGIHLHLTKGDFKLNLVGSFRQEKVLYAEHNLFQRLKRSLLL
jgi:hypothetical protein